MKLTDIGINENANETTERDVLPGGRTRVQESDVYDVRIDQAYMYEATSGSMQFVVEFVEMPTESFSHKERYTITSGRLKGQKSTYERDGKEVPLPSFTKATNLCKLVTGKPITAIDFEKKYVPIYNPETQKQEPTEMDVPMELIGKQLKIGLLKVRENKPVLVNKKWTDGPDEREVNEVEKVFDADGKTLSEQQAGTQAAFIERWKAKRQGKLEDRFKPVKQAQGTSVKTGAPAAPTKSLFED